MDFDKINKVFGLRGSNQGTIKLGPTVIADGFIEDGKSGEEHHFISHAHTDHFRKSRIRKTWDLEKPIIATEPTLKLLEAYDINTSFNHQLVKTQNHGEVITYDSGTKVRLLENNHILGSVQVEVEYKGQNTVILVILGKIFNKTCRLFSNGCNLCWSPRQKKLE